MPTIEESITIDRPPADVWVFLSQAANLPVYDGTITSAEQEGGDADLAVGIRWRGASKILGKKFDWVTECTEVTPHESTTFKAVEGAIEFEQTTTLTAEGDGTRLDYRLTAESGLGGVFGKFADPLVTKAQARNTRANLANLKELLESHAD